MSSNNNNMPRPNPAVLEQLAEMVALENTHTGARRPFTAGAYLIVTGDVEIGPGQFVRGICSSEPCASREAAQAEWDSYVERGLYEEPYETYEIRDVAPTLGEIIPEVAA